MATHQLKEAVVFTQYHSKLCGTLIDVHHLLPHFVTENIIKLDNVDEINSQSTSLQKVQKLLQLIYGPLQVGHLYGFYAMLRIMEIHGARATKDLAKEIKSSLLPGMCFHIYSEAFADSLDIIRITSTLQEKFTLFKETR